GHGRAHGPPGGPLRMRAGRAPPVHRRTRPGARRRQACLRRGFQVRTRGHPRGPGRDRRRQRRRRGACAGARGPPRYRLPARDPAAAALGVRADGRRHRRAQLPRRDDRALPRHRPRAGADQAAGGGEGHGGRARLPHRAAQGPPVRARRGGPDRTDPGRGRLGRSGRHPPGPQADHRAAAGAQSQLPLQPLRLRCPQPPLAVPRRQGVGHDRAAAELRSGRSVPGPPASAFAWFLLPMALATAGTWLALGYSRRRGLFDQPGERRSHVVATPRGGGISIAAALLLAVLLLGYLYPELGPVLQAGALGLVLVAAVGWIDDHRPLSASARLAAHALSAALLAGAVLASGHGPLVAAIAFVAVMVLVNVWNFMDGIDG